MAIAAEAHAVDSLPHVEAPLQDELIQDALIRLNRAEEIARFGHWQFDLETNTVVASEGAQRIYGYKGSRWRMEDVQQIPLPEYRQMLDKALEDLIQHGAPYNVQFKIKRPADGEMLAIQSTAEYFPDENIVLGVIEDITAQVAAEEAYQQRYMRYIIVLSLAIAALLCIVALVTILYFLQKSLHHALEAREHELALTLDSIGDAVVCTDTTGCITRMNPVAEDIIGITLKEAQGKPFSDVLQLLHARTHKPVENPVETVLQTGKTMGLANNTLLVAHHGKEYQIADSAAPIRTEDGDVHGVVMVFRDVTEQYKTQQELRAWHNLMHYIIKHAPAAIAVHDTALNYVFVSDSYLRQYDVKEQDIIGKHHYAVFPDLPDKWKKVHQRVLQGEVLSAEDDEFPRADGTIDYTSWECRPWYDANGDIAGIIIYAEVITERRKAEIQQRQTFSMLESLLKYSPSLISIINTDGEYRLVSEAHAQRLGLMKEEIVGKKIDALLPKATVADFYASIQDVLTSKEPIQKRDKIPIGERIHYYDSTIFLISFSGHEVEEKLIGAISTDITDRYLAEKKRLEQERYFRTFVEGSPDAIFLQTNHRFTYLNNAALELFGASSESELLGAPVLDRIHPDYHAIVQERIHLLNEKGLPVQKLEEIFLRLDGAELDVEVSAVPIVYEGIHGAMVYVRDTTERKRAEAERLQLERQMLQAQKLESLGVLSGGIAHDFNNILMAIMGHAELALDELPPMSPARESIANIETAAKRAADLCRQMMTYAGKSTFNLETVYLKDLIDEMLHLLKISISKKAILNVHTSEDQPPIHADPSHLRQIIMNLIMNASDAIGDRSGVITITTGATWCDEDYLMHTNLISVLKPGLYVHFEISDTGCGMDPETCNRIFDPFFTTKFTGRGLGLAAVQGIVQAHHGAIKIYSELGKGTTFKVLFPAMETQNQQGLESHKQDAAPQWSGSGCILFVDDEETLLALGARMLQHFGFKVIPAEDGRQALEIFKARHAEIDAVLMDLTMPHMNGQQAFSEMRKIDPEVQVIIASGNVADDVAARFAGKGLSGILQKPYSMKRLREALIRIFPPPQPDAESSIKRT